MHSYLFLGFVLESEMGGGGLVVFFIIFREWKKRLAFAKQKYAP